MNYIDKSLANTLRNAGCQVFLNTLDKIGGPKDLVLSKTVLVQLDSICGMQKLRQNAVDKVFKLQASPVFSETRNRVYVIRPSVEEVKQVADQINIFLSLDDEKHIPSNVSFWIIFVPKLVHYCDTTLEEEGVYEYVTILECPLGFIPLEYDVYSLEDETIFKTLFLNKDYTPLENIVNSIQQLQFLSGNIMDVHGQGKFAKIVADKLDQHNLTAPQPKVKSGHDLTNKTVKDFQGLKFDDKTSQSTSPAFTDLYLIDRDNDFASVLLSQLNYEGILDENFNVICNKLEFDDEKTTVRHSLISDHDPIYRDIRDKHFSTVISQLKTRNYEMKEKYNRSQEMNPSSLKKFVAQELKGLQAEFKCLGLHIGACEEILRQRNKYDFGDQLRTEQNIIDGTEIRKCLDFVDKMIAHQLNQYVPLRLLSLLSLTQGGLPPRDYKKYHSLYCENYGLFNNVTFSNLKKLGLITEMNLSLNSLTCGLLSYSSTDPATTSKSNASSLSLTSFTGAVSSLTERASGRVAAAISSSVLPRRGNLALMLKKFQLVPEIGDSGYNIRDPKDPAFVFGGAYIPLICQLIDSCQFSQAKKANQLNMNSSELLKLLSGPNFKRRQAFLNSIPSTSSVVPKTGERAILIYFIGGVTFAEITGLRYIAKKRNIKLAVACTSITNGNRLIESLLPANR